MRDRPIKPAFAGMTNKRMAELLSTGEAIDLRSCRVADGVYRLETFKEGVDYCDSELEAWMWSIGLNLETGLIFAARDGRYYQNPGFRCLWLR